MPSPESPRRGRRVGRWVALALGLIGLAGVTTWWALRGPAAPPWRLAIPLHTFDDTSGEVAFSPDGRTIAVPGIRLIPPFAPNFPPGLIPEYGAAQGVVRVRDAATGALVRELSFDPIHSATTVRPIVFAPDGKLVVAGNWCEPCSQTEPVLKVWEVASGRLVTTLKLPAGEPREVTFARDGRTFLVLTQTQDNSRTPFQVLRWETATWTPIVGMTIPLSGIYGTALAPGGELVAATQFGSNSVFLFEVPTGREVSQIMLRIPPNTNAPSGSLRFAPDGRTVVATDFRHELQLLDVPTRTVRAIIPQSKDGFRFTPWFALAPDSQTLALADAYAPAESPVAGLARAVFAWFGRSLPQPDAVGRVTFIDVATGRRRSSLDGVPPDLNRLTFAPDGQTLVIDGKLPAVAPASAPTPEVGVAEVRASQYVSGPENSRVLHFWNVPPRPAR